MTNYNTNIENQLVTDIRTKKLLIPKSVFMAYSSQDLCIDYYLGRHYGGDWGLASDAEKEANRIALKNNGRTISYFKVAGHMISISTQDQKTNVDLVNDITIDAEVA